MDENRLQADLKLIQALFDCPSGEKAQILATNRNIVDAGLVESKKNTNTANLLINACRLDSQFRFLMQVLEATRYRYKSPQKLYKLLQANLELLDDDFIIIIRCWATVKLAEVEPQQAQEIAANISNFSNLMQRFALGEQTNMEIAILSTGVAIAIAGYEIATTIFTRETFPENWATIQSSLGIAYSNRIKEDKAKNIEIAISFFQAALAFYTREAFPEEWAMTQHNLGIAYSQRINEDKAENIEAAISCYNLALQVRTREAFPEKWAMSQNNLGNAYKNRIKQDKAENLEAAIRCYNLASYVYTRETFAQEWATTQHNLGISYSERIKGDKAENLEAAIHCYNLALQVYTRKAFPENWAMTQHNLGISYSERINEDRAENLEAAIRCYNLALTFYTRETFPQEWAMVQHNLGVAYTDRINGDKAENIEAAIRCFQNALTFYSPTSFPINCLEAARNLGNLANASLHWQVAIEGYEQAIQAVEQSRELANTNEKRQEIQENTIDVYFGMVQACIASGLLNKALETVASSKARNLAELLANRELVPKGEIPKPVIQQLKRLRREIAVQQRQFTVQARLSRSMIGESSNVVNFSEDAIKEHSKYLIQLQQQLNQLIDEEITPIDPTFAFGQRVKTIPFAEIRNLLDEDAAIIEWYITQDKFLTFIVTRNSLQPDVWESSKEDWEKLQQWAKEYLINYTSNKQQWQQQLSTGLGQLAEILHLDQILSRIPNHIQRLILIPHQVLHLFPLHVLEGKKNFSAFTDTEKECRCLIDLFPGGVSYAPSCQLLQLCQNRGKQKYQEKRFFAIQNSTLDLNYTNIEVATIRQQFYPDDYVLVREQATKAAILTPNKQLESSQYAHFSCHGKFNFEFPLESALFLADSQLNLGEIFGLELNQCRLVTLSACETGLIDFRNTSDEYIGLPSGFLFSGSPNVVSSLWAVNDLSTALLMIRFYQNLQSHLNVTIALNQAQIWLRDATTTELKGWTEKLFLTPIQREALFDWFYELEISIQKPFQSPYYWAAFSAIGQ
jgi:CHAT domain-containing protein/tetratricopeptide (TPR) repeat protein